MFEKVIIITLLYLTTLGDIKMQSFEVVSGESCESWYNTNVKVLEKAESLKKKGKSKKQRGKSEERKKKNRYI